MGNINFESEYEYELYYLSRFPYKVIRSRTKTIVISQQYKNSKNITIPKQKCQISLYIYMSNNELFFLLWNILFKYASFHRPPNGEPCHVGRHKTQKATTQNQPSNIHIIHKKIAQAQQNPIWFPKPDNSKTSVTSLNLYLLCSYRD
jgi:hypothetical protein